MSAIAMVGSIGLLLTPDMLERLVLLAAVLQLSERRLHMRKIGAGITCLLILQAPAIAADPGGAWIRLPYDSQYSDVAPKELAVDETTADGRDWRGLRRDTGYFLAYQAAAIAILYASPESVSGWTDEQKEDYDLSIWWDNVTHTTWDEDDFYINYALHPYWGAAYYVRARERGLSTMQSFWYSALLSSLYEFGAEALFERPSTQDLFVTPVIGSLLGHYFMHVRGNVRDREQALGYRKTGDKWLMVLTDPLGSLNRQFDKWFGWEESSAGFLPYYRVRHPDAPAVRRPVTSADREFGIRFTFSWE